MAGSISKRPAHPQGTGFPFMSLYNKSVFLFYPNHTHERINQTNKLLDIIENSEVAEEWVSEWRNEGDEGRVDLNVG